MPLQSKETLLRRQTDVVWLVDYLLTGGLDDGTSSATITFVSRKGHPYGVTCRHVFEKLAKDAAKKRTRHPTLAIRVQQSFLHLASWRGIGLETTFVSPPGIDIAITPLDIHWPKLSEQKNKAFIDLDHWREPDWDRMVWGGAAGYPDEHKHRHQADGQELVATPFLRSVAAVSSRLGRHERIITLSSQLEKPHSWFFSGLSGGPLCLTDALEGSTVEDEDTYPCGIVFEGYPATGRLDATLSETPQPTFLDVNDLFFRAYTLTPEIFDEWMEKAEPIKPINY